MNDCRLDVVVLGSPSAFTSLLVQDLVAAGVRVGAVVLHRPRRRRAGPHPEAVPVVSAAHVETIASAHRIPIIGLDEMSEERALDTASRCAPDLVVIACFPRILGERWLALAPHGAFNLHPSRLPAYRGPSPLFWQFRHGERRMGITVHRANAVLDAGPVVAAGDVAVAPGASAGEVSAALVRRGAALLVDAMARIEAGTLREHPQDEARASCFGRPDDDAFRIPCSWPAERAFRFMRGTREWGRAFTIETGKEALVVERALDFEARGGREGRVRREKRVVVVGFAAGTLRAVLAGPPGDAGIAMGDALVCRA